MKLSTSFRAAYAYDNLLYIVAGRIIAQHRGKSWGDAVREKILAPLGMTGTTTSLAENAGNPDVASAHSKINGKVAAVKSMPVPNAVGAVGINTNAEDIAKWMMVLLDGGKIAGGIDKAAAMADKKTKGKYHDKIATGTAKAKDGLDKLDHKNDDIPDETPGASTTPQP